MGVSGTALAGVLAAACTTTMPAIAGSHEVRRTLSSAAGPARTGSSETGRHAEGEDAAAAGVDESPVGREIGELLDRPVGDVDPLDDEAQVLDRAVADLQIDVVGRADAVADIGVAACARQISAAIGGRDPRTKAFGLEIERRVGRPFR